MSGQGQGVERTAWAEVRDQFEHLFASLNEHDVSLIPELYAEDVVFDDDAWPKTMHGHADVEEFLSALWRASPDFRFEMVEGPYLSVDGRGAAVRVRTHGTMTGAYDPPGLRPTNTQMSTEFAGFYEFEGHLAKRIRVIVNMNHVGVQTGAVPPPGSLAERVALGRQRLNAWRQRRRHAAPPGREEANR